MSCSRSVVPRERRYEVSWFCSVQSALEGVSRQIPKFQLKASGLIEGIFANICQKVNKPLGRGLCAGYPKVKVLIVFEPVSYTHLDVYKRQGLACGFVGQGEPRIAPTTDVVEGRSGQRRGEPRPMVCCHRLSEGDRTKDLGAPQPAWLEESNKQTGLKLLESASPHSHPEASASSVGRRPRRLKMQ